MNINSYLQGSKLKVGDIIGEKMDNNMNVREIALEVLIKVDKQKSYSNLELNKSLSNVDLSREDTNFLTEIVYGTIQRLNTIDWILQQF